MVSSSLLLPELRTKLPNKRDLNPRIHQPPTLETGGGRCTASNTWHSKLYEAGRSSGAQLQCSGSHHATSCTSGTGCNHLLQNLTFSASCARTHPDAFCLNDMPVDCGCGFWTGEQLQAETFGYRNVATA
eukprot:jgi/Ulvmu1/11883/UM081_0041.1